MKKSLVFKAVLLPLLAAFALNANAQVFTGTFGNTSNFYTTEDSGANKYYLEQSNFLSGGVRIPFNGAGTVYLASQASLNFDFTACSDYKKLENLNFDIDLLKFNAFFQSADKNSFLLSFGRFPVSDITGIIYSQPVDGLLVQFKTQALSASLSLSCTSFLNGLNNPVFQSDGNVASGGYSLILGEKLPIYQFAPSYAIASASFSAPYLFANQTLGLETLCILGLPGVGTSTDTDSTRLYATLFMNGPLSRFIFYDVSTTFEAINTFEKMANLTKFSVSLYPGFLSSAITVGASYASGKQFGDDGFLIQFVPFTKVTAVNSKGGMYYSGLTKASASFSVKPLSKLYVRASYAADFANPDETFAYYGSEASMLLTYQMFTDLQLNLNLYGFMGADSADNKMGAAFNATLSF